MRRVLSLHAGKIQIVPVQHPGGASLNWQTRLKRFNFDIRNLSNGRQRHILCETYRLQQIPEAQENCYIFHLRFS